jgi:D-amino-acid dehydrogenase
MSDNRDAIVIGGGVIGMTTAYYLSKQGWKVRLLEARRVGAGCSHGNCGFICPSHVLPLTIPGAPWRIIGKIFSQDSPLSIKLRFDPALWGWLVRFALRCREPNMMQVAEARHALLSSSMELYRQLLTDESLDVEWQDRGLLLVFRSSKEFNAYESTATLLQERFGVVGKPYEGKHLTDLEPSLREGCAGGWHYAGDSHLRPDKLMSALALLLRSCGVELVEGVTARQFNVDNGRAHAIETSAGRMTAQLIVLATGAESFIFARQLGCRIPIQPGKGYSITMPRPDHAPSIPLIFEDYHVAVTPWSSGLRIGSTMEFAGYDRTINQRRIALFKRAAAEYLVEPCDRPIQEEWYGWRPMTYDELPCIGSVPKASNVIVAAGHGMVGVASATSTGKLVAELASGIEPHIDPAPYAPDRFSQRR